MDRATAIVSVSMATLLAATLLSGCAGNPNARGPFANHRSDQLASRGADTSESLVQPTDQRANGSSKTASMAGPNDTTDSSTYISLDDQLNPPTRPETTARRTTDDSNDDWLNLFGEVDGRGGLTMSNGAIESIAQVSFAVEGSDGEPDTDSTGQFVAYSSTQHHPTRDIYYKSVNGRTVTQLTHDPANDRMPAYSPDNSQIAFCSDRAGDYNIYIMDAQGGNAVQVTSDPGHEIHPSWSPDGKHLVFSRLSETSGRWEIWVTDVGDYNSRRFIAFGLCPEWNPDPAKNLIVYQQARERGSRLFGIWTVEYTDGQANVHTEIVSAANAAAINPSWSHDGEMITFTTIVEPGLPGSSPVQSLETADIWLVNLDGSNRANLTNGAYLNVEPTWSPDGLIYFVSNRGGKDNIWSIAPERTIATARGPANRTAPGAAPGVAEVSTQQP